METPQGPHPAPRRDLLLVVVAEREGVCRCCQVAIGEEERKLPAGWERQNRLRRKKVVQIWCDHCQVLSCRQYWSRLGHANALCRGNVRAIESGAEIKD